jgi:hypothetical protein
MQMRSLTPTTKKRTIAIGKISLPTNVIVFIRYRAIALLSKDLEAGASGTLIRTIRELLAVIILTADTVSGPSLNRKRSTMGSLRGYYRIESKPQSETSTTKK